MRRTNHHNHHRVGIPGRQRHHHALPRHHHLFGPGADTGHLQTHPQPTSIANQISWWQRTLQHGRTDHRNCWRCCRFHCHHNYHHMHCPSEAHRLAIPWWTSSWTTSIEGTRQMYLPEARAAHPLRCGYHAWSSGATRPVLPLNPGTSSSPPSPRIGIDLGGSSQRNGQQFQDGPAGAVVARRQRLRHGGRPLLP